MSPTFVCLAEIGLSVCLSVCLSGLIAMGMHAEHMVTTIVYIIFSLCILRMLPE